MWKKRKIPILVLVSILVLIYLGWRIFGNKQSQPQYQTAPAEKGTLVTSVSASGNISAGGTVNISSSIAGIVNTVYVKNGDTVTQGEQIADIAPDLDSAQKQAAAWSSYLQAKNQLQSAEDNLNSLQSAEFKANQKFMADAVFRELSTNDPVYIQENADWLQAEANYKNQANIIAQAQASLNSAWLNYQQTSSIITAPASGIVNNLTIADGMPIANKSGSSSNSSNNSVSLQKLGTITMPEGRVQATVNLSEIDAGKVNAGQKVTLSLDAFPNKTFTGKVLLIDTNGSISSGVTTYPATITFDTAAKNIYPNMAVTAKIITDIKDNVILVPSAAVSTNNGSSVIRVLRNAKVNETSVEIGNSNDTQTEVISGIKEGDEVITGTASTGTNSRNQTASPFGAFGGNRGFGGGAVRINR